MAKHNCAICGAEIGLMSEQKLADGNYICRKVCSKKCFKVFDRVAATLTDVTDHIEQIEFGTKVWNQIFVPLKKTKVKEEKLRQVTGLSGLIVYVSPSTGLIAFVENRYKFMFFGKSTYACVYRLADLVSYTHEEEKKTNSEGQEEVRHFMRFGFKNTKGMSNFRLGVSSLGQFSNNEQYFDKLFGIEASMRSGFAKGMRQVDAAKAAFAAVKAAKDGTLDEAQAAETMQTLEAIELGDRTEWIAKADAALASVK